jgi:hypothetical protein
MRRGRLGMILTAVPAVLAAGYAVVLALRVADLLTSLYHFPDAAGAPLLGEAIAQGQGPVRLPTQTAFGPLLVDAATAWLPGHRILWMGLGMLVAIGGVAMVTVGAWRLMGSRALLTLALAIAAPPVLLWTLLLQDGHVSTWTATALLGLAVGTVAAGRPAAWSLVLLGLAAGVAEVTDPQLVVAGLLPFVIAVATVRARERRPMTPILLVAGTLVAGVVLCRALMAFLHIEVIDIFSPHPSVGGVTQGIGLALRALVWMGDGGWYGDALGPAAIVGIGFAIVALVLPPLIVTREWRRWRGDDERSKRRLAWALFWTFSEAGLLGSFLLSGYSGEVYQAHYISQISLCVAALLPLAVPESGRIRSLATAAVAVIVTTITVGVATVSASQFAPPLVSPHIDELAAFLSSHHLNRGYASYWDSFNVTWASEEKVQVLPLLQGDLCFGGRATSICPYGFVADSWYRPQPGPSFIAVRDDGPCLHRLPDLGSAVAEHHVGGWTVRVYADDVAARLGRAVNLICPG